MKLLIMQSSPVSCYNFTERQTETSAPENITGDGSYKTAVGS
jgi:hypothetical protein